MVLRVPAVFPSQSQHQRWSGNRLHFPAYVYVAGGDMTFFVVVGQKKPKDQKNLREKKKKGKRKEKKRRTLDLWRKGVFTNAYYTWVEYYVFNSLGRRSTLSLQEEAKRSTEIKTTGNLHCSKNCSSKFLQDSNGKKKHM